MRNKCTSLMLTGLLIFSKSVHAEPNVLLIVADDMGIDASQCYNVGNQQAKMPTLEELCREGRVYENAYASPTCSPTRASMMTGRYGFRTGIGGPISANKNSQGLSSDETSLFDVLDSVSYNTALIGKWHLAGGSDGFEHPETLGVDHYFGMYNGGVEDYFNWEAVDNAQTVRVENYATTELTNRAMDWIDQQESSWFLWLAYNAPHAPFHLPPQALHTAGEIPEDKSTIKKNPLPYYNAMLEALDTEMGRMLGSMNRETRDNTVIIFVGDNGTPSSVNRKIYGDQRSKGSIYDGGTHVPLIVSGPQVQVGRSSTLVNSTDLFATISSIAGVSKSVLDETSAIDSIDFSDTFSGVSGAREFAFIEHFGNKKRRPDVFGWAIRNMNYKLVAEDGVEPAIFRLANDPFEKEDLIGSVQTDEVIAGELQNLKNAYDRLQRAE